MPFRDTQDLLPEECIDDSAWRNTFDQRRTLMNDYNSIFKHEPDGAQTCLVSIDVQNLWPRDGELCTEWRLFVAGLLRAQRPQETAQIVQQAAKASFPPFPSPDQNKSPEPIVRQYSRRVG